MQKIDGTKLLAVALFFLPLICCSCMSTREYVKTQSTLYEDDIAVEERYELVRDSKVVETRTKKFYDLADVCSLVEEDDTKLVMYAFTAIKEESSKSSGTEVTFSLMEYQAFKGTGEMQSSVLGTKSIKVRDGIIVSYTDPSGKTYRAKGDTFSGSTEQFFDRNLDALVQSLFDQKERDDHVQGVEPTHAADTEKMQYGSSRSVVTAERVKVESTPNGKYIFYAIIGKPFVIVGTTAWNLIKCAGYALYNFAGGYNATTGGNAYWKMPSYSQAKQKASVAKEANRIQYYPEYHLPFTDNVITVDTYDRDISVLALADENAELITPIEHQELNNTMSVSRSAAADAASTAAVAGLIGTVVTIPVSVTTWIGGAIVGIMGQVKK